MLGMIVRREREIREFVKTPFYRVVKTGGPMAANSLTGSGGQGRAGLLSFSNLYKENGFKEKKDAREADPDIVSAHTPLQAVMVISKKRRKIKILPLLYNLAELQNECPGCLRSVRMRRCGRAGAVRKKAGHLSQNRCQSACPPQWQRRFIKILEGSVISAWAGSLQLRF